MLELKDVDQYYRGSHILRNVSIDAKIGEITLVLGRNGIGFVPQGREIFGRLTVEDNLKMGLAYESASAQIPAELYELFPVLKQMLGRRGGDLSGGQQQQLAIARALAANPKPLILDEYIEGIQPSVIKDIGRVLHLLADRKQWRFCWLNSSTISQKHSPTKAS